MENSSQEPKLRINGHVYDQNGRALSAAKVSCNGRNTITLFDGFYEFADLTPEEYTIKVSLEGFEEDRKSVILEDSQPSTFDFHLKEVIGTARIEGYVRDAKSKVPLSGTVILILPVSNRYIPIGEDGYYSIENLPPGVYDVSTSLPEYEDVKATITLSEGEVKRHDFYCGTYRDEEPPWG